MHAFAFAARCTADERLVNLHRPLRADLISIRAHHAATELVKHRERGLTARQPELPLKLRRGDARRLRGHQVRRPKPCGKRRPRVLHHSPGGKEGVFPASRATKNGLRAGHAPGFTRMGAGWAHEAFRPTHCLQVLRTGGVIGEELLELRERLRIGKPFHAPTVTRIPGVVNGSSVKYS